jgi:hypothetical protein
MAMILNPACLNGIGGLARYRAEFSLAS